MDASLAQWSAEPANRIHAWTYPAANQWNRVSDGQGNSFGLHDMIAFAKAHGKPIAIAETGVGGFGDRGPMDDPAFPLWLASTLAQSGASVAFVNVWDLNPGDGDWRFSDPAASKPLTAAAWAKYFGAGSDAPAGAGSPVVAPPPPAAPATVTLGAGPDGLVGRVSEDAWKGHAQFTVSVDGAQIGGVQTATAAHAAGQTQAFTLRGTFGAGPHKVAVAFLNDAWGGSAAADRNLYVDSITYNGTTAAQGAVLGSNGSQSFLVGAPTDTVATDLNEYTLGAGGGLRELRFIGEGDFVGTGNELANVIRGGTGADTLDGGAGADTLTGGAGRDGFVFRAGQANGDTVTDFAGALSGERLSFAGYGAGATLTRLNATDFEVSSAGGTIRDTIHLANAPTLVLGDYRFL